MKLNNRSKRLIILAIAALVYFLFSEYNKPIDNNSSDTELDVNKELVYTKHALCRMDCREVRKEEVIQILKQGKINNNKSDNSDKPCPTIAYEGVSDDGQHLRIIFAKCNDVTKVVTAIDLDNEYQCYCD